MFPKILSIGLLSMCLAGCIPAFLEDLLGMTPRDVTEDFMVDEEYEDGTPRIRPGVFLIVQVSVVGEPMHSMELMVDPKGELTVPYLLTEPVMCDKMSTEDLQQELTKLYLKYIRHPQVTVRFGDVPSNGGVSPYGFVKVMGMVNTPGPVNMPPTRNLTLTMALRSAGGLRSFADKKRIQVSRREKDKSLTKLFVDYDAIGTDGGNDVKLKAGDVIYVHESKW